MKKMFKYLPMIIGFMMVVSSCGDDDGDDAAPATPQPTASVSINGTANLANYEVVPGEPIIIAITAQKADRDLDEIKMVQNGANAITTGVGFTFTSTSEMYNLENNIAVSLKTADDETLLIRDTLNSITGNLGETTYTFTVTDKAGNVATASFKITVKAAEVPFTESLTGRIFHIEGGNNTRGSWSLETDTTVAKAMSATMADIRNTSPAGAAITGAFRVGTSRATTTFIIADSGFDYDNATVTSATDAYNAGTIDADNADVATVGKVYIFKVSGEIVAVKMTEINTTDATASAVNTGFIRFEYKK